MLKNNNCKILRQESLLNYILTRQYRAKMAEAVYYQELKDQSFTKNVFYNICEWKRILHLLKLFLSWCWYSRIKIQFLESFALSKLSALGNPSHEQRSLIILSTPANNSAFSYGFFVFIRRLFIQWKEKFSTLLQ